MAHPAIHVYNEIVRFEDCDPGAIVYHPMYLNYMERARSQSLLDRGSSFKRMLDEGLALVVASVTMKFVRPLYLEERFLVATQVDDYKQSVMNLTQVIVMNPEDIKRERLNTALRQMPSLRFFANIKLVTISQKTMRPTPMPAWLTDMLT